LNDLYIFGAFCKSSKKTLGVRLLLICFLIEICYIIFLKQIRISVILTVRPLM